MEILGLTDISESNNTTSYQLIYTTHLMQLLVCSYIIILLIPNLCDARTKITIAAVKLILYYTGSVIVILLARISVAPISVTCLLVQFVHRVHGNTNKSRQVWY